MGSSVRISRHHVGQILGIDAADLQQRRHVARRQQFQIVEQGLNRRVQAVALPQLDRQTFAEVPGEDAGRIEALDPQQNPLDMLQVAVQLLGKIGKAAGDVAGGIQQIDQRQPDQPVHRIGQIDIHLADQVIAQAEIAAERLFEVEVAVLEIAAAAARRPVAERLGAVEAAIGGAAVGPDVFKIGVERRVGAAGHVVRRGQFMGVELTLIGGIDRRPRILLVRAVDAGTTLGAALEPFPSPAPAGLGRGAAVTTAELRIVALKQGILLDLAVDIIRQLHVGELQQLDSLLQLRSHDKRLGLPEVETL